MREDSSSTVDAAFGVNCCEECCNQIRLISILLVLVLWGSRLVDFFSLPLNIQTEERAGFRHMASCPVWKGPRPRDCRRKRSMYARVTPIRFPPALRPEVVGVAQGLVSVLQQQRGYNGLNVLTDAEEGEGLIISYWETEADAEDSEASFSYIGQMSMMSSFLSERLISKTYDASVHA
jgi:hypothetical protein